MPDQPALIEIPEPASAPASASGARRRTSKGIAVGDIVEVDKKGRRFHAEVAAVQQGASGRFELELRPFSRQVAYRRASVREVVGLWRRVAP